MRNCAPMVSSPDRRVRPVPQEPEEELREFIPSTIPRPAAAFFLALGPVLAILGLFGWLRLVSGAPLSQVRGFSLADFLTDGVLLLLFIVPHSALARGFGKRILNKPFGPCGERPLYVFFSGLLLCLLCFFWKTTGPVLWDWNGLPHFFGRILQATGLILLFWSGLVLGSAHLFGIPHLKELRRGGAEPSAELIALAPYSLLRQPMNVGFILLLLGMTEVTPDRLLLGLITLAWILFVAPTEERDASLQFGEGYEHYKEQTPRWIPRVGHQEE